MQYKASIFVTAILLAAVSAIVLARGGQALNPIVLRPGQSLTVSGLNCTLWYQGASSRQGQVVCGNPIGTPAPTPTPTSTPKPTPTPPPSGASIKTDDGVYAPPPAPALPPAGGKFTDPTFGTEILRVTDARDGAVNHHQYAYWLAHNADSTLLYATVGGQPTLYDFDPVAFTVKNKRPLFAAPPAGQTMRTEDACWSALRPAVIYLHTYGARLYELDVRAQTWTLLADLGAIHVDQMTVSADDGVFAMTEKTVADEDVGALVWRRSNGNVIRRAESKINECHVDKSGRYLIIALYLPNPQSVETRIVDLQTGAVENLTDGAPDYGLGHGDAGRGLAVAAEDWNNRILARSLSTPHLFAVVQQIPDWTIGYHLSLTADAESWATVSTYRINNGTPFTGKFQDEIYQVATDGSQRLRRLAHHHSAWETARDYWASPRAVASKDGRWITFTSNWGDASRTDVFVVRGP